MRTKKLPKLDTLLRDPAEQRTPEEANAAWRDWAIARGLKIERHERPVI